MTNNEIPELKILLYRYLDSLDYEYERQYSVSRNNMLLADITDDERYLESVAKSYGVFKQKELVSKIIGDISRILEHN